MKGDNLKKEDLIVTSVPSFGLDAERRHSNGGFLARELIPEATASVAAKLLGQTISARSDPVFKSFVAVSGESAYARANS
jgi:hypothetical protein